MVAGIIEPAQCEQASGSFLVRTQSAGRLRGGFKATGIGQAWETAIRLMFTEEQSDGIHGDLHSTALCVTEFRGYPKGCKPHHI